MVARAYHDLGAVAGETTGARAPYSMRGNDADRFQNFIIECDPGNPFTGVVYFQISQDEPPADQSNTGADLTWTDLARVDIVNEGGTFFVQFEVEAAMIRRIVKTGDYTSGSIKSIKSMR